MSATTLSKPPGCHRVFAIWRGPRPWLTYAARPARIAMKAGAGHWTGAATKAPVHAWRRERSHAWTSQPRAAWLKRGGLTKRQRAAFLNRPFPILSPSTCSLSPWTSTTPICASASIHCWRRPRWPSVCAMWPRSFLPTPATTFKSPIATSFKHFSLYNQRMIAHLRGRLLAKHPQQAIIEAGGVGYDVVISVTTFSALPAEGSEVSLFIHTHVR